MPRLPRFFIDPSQVAGSRITIIGDDLRHVRTVLRKQPGDRLTLLDGQGVEYTVRIVALERDGIVTEIEGRVARRTAGPCITLGQGIAKSDKMDWIVQKATELGVSVLVPLVTERTIVKVRDEEKRVSRWQKISREAAMQSSRPDIPRVEPIQKFSAFLQRLSNPPSPPFAKGGDSICPPLKKGEQGGFSSYPTLLLLPWEEGTEPLRNVLKSNAGAKETIVLIGPEGGFSQSEAESAKGKGFHLVSLGPNILRTETAAIAVLSMLLYEYA